MLFISSQKHGNVDKNGWVFTLINAPIVTVNDFQYLKLWSILDGKTTRSLGTGLIRPKFFHRESAFCLCYETSRNHFLVAELLKIMKK